MTRRRQERYKTGPSVSPVSLEEESLTLLLGGGMRASADVIKFHRALREPRFGHARNSIEPAVQFKTANTSGLAGFPEISHCADEVTEYQ